MTGDNDENFKDTDEDIDEDLNYEHYEDGNEDGPRFWREYKGIGDAGSTADIRMLWSAMVCYSLPWLVCYSLPWMLLV